MTRPPRPIKYDDAPGLGGCLMLLVIIVMVMATCGALCIVGGLVTGLLQVTT